MDGFADNSSCFDPLCYKNCRIVSSGRFQTAEQTPPANVRLLEQPNPALSGEPVKGAGSGEARPLTPEPRMCMSEFDVPDLATMNADSILSILDLNIRNDGEDRCGIPPPYPALAVTRTEQLTGHLLFPTGVHVGASFCLGSRWKRRKFCAGISR
jgi:hypothetical protein